MVGSITGRRHPSVLLLAGAVQKRSRILDSGPRRSPCPPLCLKAGTCMSELPLTAVCVICSLKSLMMEISQSPQWPLLVLDYPHKQKIFHKPSLLKIKWILEDKHDYVAETKGSAAPASPHSSGRYQRLHRNAQQQDNNAVVILPLVFCSLKFGNVLLVCLQEVQSTVNSLLCKNHLCSG